MTVCTGLDTGHRFPEITPRARAHFFSDRRTGATPRHSVAASYLSAMTRAVTRPASVSSGTFRHKPLSPHVPRGAIERSAVQRTPPSASHCSGSTPHAPGPDPRGGLRLPALCARATGGSAGRASLALIITHLPSFTPTPPSKGGSGLAPRERVAGGGPAEGEPLIAFGGCPMRAPRADPSLCHLFRRCTRLRLQPLAYLWRRDQEALLGEMVSRDVHALIIKVAAFGKSGAVGRGRGGRPLPRRGRTTRICRGAGPGNGGKEQKRKSRKASVRRFRQSVETCAGGRERQSREQCKKITGESSC